MKDEYIKSIQDYLDVKGDMDEDTCMKVAEDMWKFLNPIDVVGLEKRTEYSKMVKEILESIHIHECSNIMVLVGILVCSKWIIRYGYQDTYKRMYDICSSIIYKTNPIDAKLVLQGLDI